MVVYLLFSNIDLIKDFKNNPNYIDHEFYLISAKKIDNKCIFISFIPYMFDFLEQDVTGIKVGIPVGKETVYRINEIRTNCAYLIDDNLCKGQDKGKRCNIIKENFHLSEEFKIKNIEFNSTLYKIEGIKE